jgi:hypothetical protein
MTVNGYTAKNVDVSHAWSDPMADPALKLNETWARAANVTSRHERDHFVEALREHQREKEKENASDNRSDPDRSK